MTANPAPNDERTYSLDAFRDLPEDDAFRIELVRGRLVHEPRPAPLHGRVMTRVAYHLERYTEHSNRGAVLSDIGFVLAQRPPTVRGPDVAFVSREGIPEGGYDEQGFWHIAPDLAVEIVSPSNSTSELRQKACEYLDAGVRLVWVVDPGTRTVTVYRSRDDVRTLEADDEIDGGEVLPGFRVAVAEVFRL